MDIPTARDIMQVSSMLNPVQTTKNDVPYVLALTLLDAGKSGDWTITSDTHIRICVRWAEVNPTHPDIVSVPTQRIPRVVAEDLLRELHPRGESGETALLAGRTISNERHSGHDSLIYVVESLLTSKLGVSPELERGQIAFAATVAGKQRGYAIYPELGSEEELQMLNAVVGVTRGSHLFPENTASYSLSRWVPVSAFMKMWNDKDVTSVGVTAREALQGVCVHGLCISSTYDILRMYLDHGYPVVRRTHRLGVA